MINVFINDWHIIVIISIKQLIMDRTIPRKNRKKLR